jgi:hypothetical protein
VISRLHDTEGLFDLMMPSASVFMTPTIIRPNNGMFLQQTESMLTPMKAMLSMNLLMPILVLPTKIQVNDLHANLQKQGKGKDSKVEGRRVRTYQYLSC